jgi:hypothetical protein
LFNNLSKKEVRKNLINESLLVRGQTGNGAKFGLERSANRASVAGAAKVQTYRFRRPFFGSFFGRTKKERRKNEERTKKKLIINENDNYKKILTHPNPSAGGELERQKNVRNC